MGPAVSRARSMADDVTCVGAKEASAAAASPACRRPRSLRPTSDSAPWNTRGSAVSPWRSKNTRVGMTLLAGSAINSITNARGKGAYPVSFYTFVLVNLFMGDKHKSAALRDFLKWAVTDGQVFSEGLGFARLPEVVARREVLDIASIQ